jgi:hypothetical protein
MQGLLLLGKCSTTQATPQAQKKIFYIFFFQYRRLNSGPCPQVFYFGYFEIGSHFMLRMAWTDHNPPIYASCVAGMTNAYHHAQLHWLRWGIFAQDGLELKSS